jgi:hypothetical protein
MVRFEAFEYDISGDAFNGAIFLGNEIIMGLNIILEIAWKYQENYALVFYKIFNHIMKHNISND